MLPIDISTTLPTGRRLRVRMPQRFDVARLRSLTRRLGLEVDDRQLSRVLRFDPRERIAVVATALVNRREEAVGLAVMDRFADEPELVLADEAAAPGVRRIVEGAVRSHARHPRRIG